jgi:hypothetical protein
MPDNVSFMGHRFVMRLDDAGYATLVEWLRNFNAGAEDAAHEFSLQQAFERAVNAGIEAMAVENDDAGKDVIVDDFGSVTAVQDKRAGTTTYYVPEPEDDREGNE